MKSHILIKRYSQGLANSIETDKEFKSLSTRLEDFHNLLSNYKKLKVSLSSPFLPPAKKIQIAQEILDKASFPKKVSRFILLLVEHDRLGLLPAILESLPELWDKKKGISTIEVYSAVPLKENQKKRLKEKLELLEKGQVSLKYRIEPGLIGGLSLKKENIVYDVSIRGSLESLKEKICEEKG